MGMFNIAGTGHDEDACEHADQSERIITFNGRPNFEAFAKALEAEAKWIAEIHSGDKTGQAVSDQRLLLSLANRVRAVGKRLSYT